MTFNKAALITEAIKGSESGGKRASIAKVQVITQKRPENLVPANLLRKRIGNKYSHLLFQPEDTLEKIYNLLKICCVADRTINIGKNSTKETLEKYQNFKTEQTYILTLLESGPKFIHL